MKSLALFATLAIGSLALADTHTVNVSSGLFTRATNNVGQNGSLSVNATWSMTDTSMETSGNAFFTTQLNQFGSTGSRTVRLTDVQSIWHRDGVAILEGRGTYKVQQNFSTLTWTGNVRVIVTDNKEPGQNSPLRDRFTVRFWGDGGQGYMWDGYVTSGDLRVTESVNQGG